MAPNEKVFKKVTLVFAFLMALFGGEIALRVIRPERLDVARYEDIYDQTYSPSKGGMVVSLKPNIVRKRWGTEVKTNSYGERDFDYSLKKVKGVYRIAVIGDSVAFGYGISLNNTFAKILERKLNENSEKKYEVLLFGRPGYSISNVYYSYLDKVKNFEPDMIIYAMVLNDFEKSFKEEKPKSQETKKSNSFLKTLKTVNRHFFSFFRRHSAIYNLFIDFIFQLLTKTKVVDINEARALECFYPESEEFKVEWENTQKWLLLLRDLFGDEKKEFLVCLFPYQFQIDNEMVSFFKSKGVNIPDGDLLLIQKKIVQFANSNKINIIDLAEVYKQSNPKNLYIKNDYGHPNELGNEIAAKEILRYLKNDE